MTAERRTPPVRSLALISSIAYSVPNFRGPLIAALVRAGVRVYALAPDYNDRIRERVRALGAEPVDFSLERTGTRPARDLLDTWRLSRLLRSLKPDVVFSYFAKPCIYGTLAAKRAGVPRRFALVAGLGYVFEKQERAPSLKRRVLRRAVEALYRTAFRACEHVFFQNEDDIDELVGAGLLRRELITNLHGSGVDLERLRYVPAPEGPPVFLLMARLLREKGIVQYVEAARIIRRDHPEVRFVLLGGVDPNPGGLSEAEVGEWAAEGVVEWPGHVDEVQPWIEGASVFVLPSFYREGKPRSTQEAMAVGRAVITTDNIGCRDTVEEGVNGFLVPPRDVASLAAAMMRFVEDPSLAGRMGRESRRLAEERFDAHRINAVILARIGVPAAGPAIVPGAPGS